MTVGELNDYIRLGYFAMVTAAGFLGCVHVLCVVCMAKASKTVKSTPCIGLFLPCLNIILAMRMAEFGLPPPATFLVVPGYPLMPWANWLDSCTVYLDTLGNIPDEWCSFVLV